MNNKTKSPVRQYLVDITLKTLEIKYTVQSPSKVICQLHYGDIFLKLKLQPTLKVNIASFYQQKIRIPYSGEIALVFKMQRMKKQTFLGHYLIDVPKLLQDRIYSLKSKQKLQQTDAYIDFQVKIIDKKLCQDDQSQQIDQQQLKLNAKSNYSGDVPKMSSIKSQTKPRSLINGPFVVIKKQSDEVVPPTAEQFASLLNQTSQILRKHDALHQKSQKMRYFQRDSDGNLQTQKLQLLQIRLKQQIKQQQFNNNALLLIIGVLSLFVGVILS